MTCWDSSHGGREVDDDEFEHVYDEFRSMLLRGARRRLDESAAHDVVAATFETLWRKDLAYPGDDAGQWRRLAALARAVLEGHVYNEYRSRRRAESLRRRLAELDPETEPDPYTHVELTETMGSCLRQLSDADRAVIALFLAGSDTAQLATSLGCSEGAAARRRDRARQRLRTLMARGGIGRSSDPEAAGVRAQG